MPLLYGRKAISNCKLKTTKVMHFRTQLPHTSKELHTLPYPQISPARGVSPFTSFPDLSLIHIFPCEPGGVIEKEYFGSM